MVSDIFASCAKCGGIDFKDEMLLAFGSYYDDECYFEVIDVKEKG